MILIAKTITALVALMHIYFLYLEMFAWTTKGRKVFIHFPQDLFEPTKQMAANQGLYNGFLAAGLIWSFFISTPVWSANIALFFLGCVVVAGIYGGYSVSKKIFLIQSVPALIGFTFWAIIKFSL
ncbi:DUF1304 domain-containing protein [Maribacter sp. ACAM166]|uniref:DUF1304 domain-containing protein n=1 Tax=Maribacter sp. ACAM166 TaxID=2508996 RepID=UPI0010FEBF93|nr:DUF1304 domain-containing protein [Maribacter sp. ACAM166]TLP75432.1 DUF1304 domain-containing protein [Maribacter sp. ACAM166]